MKLEVEDISKSYGRIQVLSHVSFSCDAGTIMGYIGPNGSGKSTTLKVIAGLVRPDAGRVLIDGQPYRSLENPGRKVGFLLDPGAHHPGRSVRETVTLAAMMMRLRRSRVDAVLTEVGLASVPARKVGALSLGMRQRMSLAIALLGEPEVLVLDEPANGLDVEGMTWLKRLLRSLGDKGTAVVVSSHLLNELETYVDRAVILDRGRVVSDQIMRRGAVSEWTFVSGPDLDEIEKVLVAEGFEHRRGDEPSAGPGFRVRRTANEIGEAMWSRRVRVNHLGPAAAVTLEAQYGAVTSPQFRAGSIEHTIGDGKET
ncbi:ABC transporter ATP-binding protein [Sinomonas susongensis]|uniref:ABC transporter ATP-binding protein n=1 Tax=Sinomonas susongensis TaxID=1324851 RepID=UPI00148701AF|nr:ATP-binding cassette domain-containing protein [Sinomonas susongensis]